LSIPEQNAQDSAANLDISLSAVGVHLSNIHARVSFFRKSLIVAVCRDSIVGLSFEDYGAAICYLALLLNVDAKATASVLSFPPQADRRSSA
jgi:3-dehydroquinate dehydratase